MQLRSILISLLAVPLAVGCAADPAGDDVAPGDDQPPGPTALARCADPAMPVDMAWEVDNIRAPLVDLTSLGSTILVSSEDGAVKTWVLPAAGGAPEAPGYGTPFVEDGDVVPALAAAPPGPTPAFAGLDAHGRAHLWSDAGAALGDPVQVTAAAGAFVAVDEHLRWIVGGTDEQGGALTVADLETGEVAGPLETQLWHATDAAIGHGGVLVTVGDWYGCPAIEVRDPRDPATVTAYWDGCHGDGPMLQGWFRAVAVDPYATQAIAVGDGIYARFDLTNVAAGPVALAQPEQRMDHVAWSVDDDLAFTLGPSGEAGSAITVWSTVADRPLRATAVPPAIGLAADPARGLLVTARADGMVRGDVCGP